MAEPRVVFETDPSRYCHWRLAIEPPVATLTLAVTADRGLRDDYELKLNSYDLSVDIELHDAVERLRFEHPDVKVVVITGGLDKVFCAGANIQMLATASHAHKVNFCKFTNETRNAIEDATNHSGQLYLAAINGTAAGGGYELALACEDIVLVDDRASAVSLPEVPLLAVLPGTGGLTRVVDKRHVRRDIADVFATRAEGAKGQQALDWGLVDALAPRSRFDEVVHERVQRLATRSDREDGEGGARFSDAVEHVSVRIDREMGAAHLTVRGPRDGAPHDLRKPGWILDAGHQLDRVVLDLRFNEPTIGIWVLHTEGAVDAVLAADDLLRDHADHWLVRECRWLWARTLKRLELSSRTLFTVVEPGSCFAGTLAELVLVADRSFMLDADDAAASGDVERPVLVLTHANDGWYPMANGLSRLATRFWERDAAGDDVRAAFGKELGARSAHDLGLVTFAPDDLDWDDEIRVAIEERAGFSPDALTGLEANLRFTGPETMETKIFARLSAWQNWIFQRPNAVGPDGALPRYGSGTRPTFDRVRA